MIELRHIISNQNIIFSAYKAGIKLSMKELIAVKESRLSHLLGWLESDPDNVTANENGEISVSIEKISKVIDEEGTDLGLPKLISIILHLTHEGIISQPNFRFSYEWHKDGRSRPIAGLERIGCFLKIGIDYFRLPYSLYKVVNGIDRINSSLSENIEARLLVWKEIENELPSETARSITVDDYLNSTKIYFANSFELIVRRANNDINFDPILLNSKSSQTKIEGFFDSELNFEKILTPSDQEKFEEIFKQRNDCSSNYSLDRGKYIIFSEPLKKALSVVRKMQQKPLIIKLEFLKNPKTVLSEEGIDEDMLNSVFSDRIEGFGEKRVKVIPWIKIEGQDWIPSDENTVKGLRIGHESISLSQSECSVLEEKIRDAIQQEQEIVQYKDIKIPADTNTLAELAKISSTYQTQSDIKQVLSRKDASLSDLNFNDYVLYVKDNFSDIKYCPFFKSRNGIFLFESVPKIIKKSLYPHQINGVKWLIESYQKGVTGVLIADDMGLGKTLQSLAFLAWLRENMIAGHVLKRPILIVAPTGLLENWKKEHEIHLHEPGLGELILAYGTNLKQIRDKRITSTLSKPLDIQKLKDADWILTTYETLSNYDTCFAGIHYSAVILDEMQKVKTPNTRVTEAVQAIKADLIIGMTGTPIENRLADLWCLIDTLQPGRLGTLQEFSAKYEGEFSEEESKKLKCELTQPMNGLPALMLRRMKNTELKGLPVVHHHYEEEVMTQIQANAYKAILTDAQQSKEDGSHLKALQNLRSKSLHPYVYMGGSSDESYIAESARLRVTFKILDNIYKKNEKVLIFIEFREWLHGNFFLLILKRRYNLAEIPRVISGAVKGTDRQKHVDKFQEKSDKFDVMLLSPRAGGVGLTLTAANHVIHLSRWWNPAVEDQCTDRVYRIGQEKDVHVYYPMAKHPEIGEKSFDICLKNLLDKKRKLSLNLLVPPIIKDDVTQLKNSVIFDPISSVSTVNESLSLNEIKSMNPQQFEKWIAELCRKSGLIVKETPVTWDGGADLVIKNESNVIKAIIQCKHSEKERISSTAVDDLLRAEKAYNFHNIGESMLVAVTNALRFSFSVIAYSKLKKNIRLITADEIFNIGKIISESCQISSKNLKNSVEIQE